MAKKKTAKKKAGPRGVRGRKAPVSKDALGAGGDPIPPRAGGGAIIPRWGGGGPRFIGGRRVVGLGWQPDLPDHRDWSWQDLQDRSRTAVDEKAKAQHKRLGRPFRRPSALSSRVDLRDTDWLSPVEDQEALGSCTAQAVVGVLEFVMRRAMNEHTDLSRLFLYKATRNVLGWTGDTGAYIRSTIKAARLFGVPPELNWPYLIDRFEDEPSAFLYAYASNFKATMFGRLDGTSGKRTLETLKEVIACGYTAAFGFAVFSSIVDPRHLPGEVPYPRPGDHQIGGHAVVAVGYDDNLLVEGYRGQKGAVIFRNSWSRDWGDDGYGYLPYGYVENRLAIDFWTIFNADWVDEDSFA